MTSFWDHAPHNVHRVTRWPSDDSLLPTITLLTRHAIAPIPFTLVASPTTTRPLRFLINLFAGLILLIGTDHILGLPPQGLHRVQLRRPVRQPQQRHPLRLAHRGLGRMAGILVEQQGHMPASVVPPEFREERLEVAATPPLTRHEEPSPGPQVHRPEDHAASVAAAQPDPGGLSALRPGGAQGWEQQQVGLVLGQDHAAPWQGPDLPADPPFFSRARGPGSSRSAGACRRNPTGAGPGEVCPRRFAAPWCSPGPLGAKAPSSSRRGSRTAGVGRRGQPRGAALALRPATDGGP